MLSSNQTRQNQSALTQSTSKQGTANQINSICILRLSAIGDVCHAVSAVQAIQRHHPQAAITWVIGKIEHSLVNDLPGIEWITFDKTKGLQAYRDLFSHRGKPFDVLLHMQASARSNLAALLIKAKRKVGMPKHLAKEGHSLVTSEQVTLPEKTDFHVVDLFARYAYALDVPEYEPSWSIPPSAADTLWAKAQFCGEKPVLVIAAAASDPKRSWMAERYAQLSDYAAQKGFSVALTGGPSKYETTLADEICKLSATKPLNLVGKTSLKKLLALLKRADLVVAPDTGPAHMAVTQSTPVIGLYAHSNPSRTGPYKYFKYVVEVYHKHLKKEHPGKTQSFKWGTRVKDELAMQDITCDMVFAMFDKVVAREGIFRE